MHNFNAVYRHSLKHMAKTPGYWIVTTIVLIIASFIFFIMPQIYNAHTDHSSWMGYYGSLSWVTVVIPTLWVVLPIFSTYLGELNAVDGEKIYILSKPINKNGFLLAKVSASFTMSAIVLFVIWWMFIGVIIYMKTHTDPLTMFGDNHIQPVALFANMLLMIAFGSVFGNLMKYHTKGGGPTMVSACIAVAFVMVFVVFFALSNLSLTLEREHAFWFSSVMPEIIYGGLAVILVPTLWLLFLNSTVES